MTGAAPVPQASCHSVCIEPNSSHPRLLFESTINFVVALVIGSFTPPPRLEILELVETIRVPAGAGEVHEITA